MTRIILRIRIRAESSTFEAHQDESIRIKQFLLINFTNACRFNYNNLQRLGIASDDSGDRRNRQDLGDYRQRR